MVKVSNWVYFLGLSLLAANAVAGDAAVKDPFLGDPFQVRSFDTEPVAQFPSFHSTIVEYPFGSSVKAEAVPTDSAKVDSAKTVSVAPAAQPKASVLYIHGFNDYYFQREMAEKADSAGYAFYAVDLHNYGRSLREGDRIGEVHDIAEYYAELDTCIAEMKRQHPDAPVAIIGHSTGGLIATLYAAARENGKGITALVLNSPFLEMNYAFIPREIVIPGISLLGGIFPNLGVPRGDNTNYAESLLKQYRGEWEFDTAIKTVNSIPVNFAWVRAIHKAHAFVQKGMDLDTPILVMHSNCSVDEDEWTDEYTHCDGVLNVEDIKRYGARLGSQITMVEIPGALHDIVLSKKPVRDNAYNIIFNFLDETLPASTMAAE